jgi:hypothetical protein
VPPVTNMCQFMLGVAGGVPCKTDEFVWHICGEVNEHRSEHTEHVCLNCGYKWPSVPTNGEE